MDRTPLNVTPDPLVPGLNSASLEAQETNGELGHAATPPENHPLAVQSTPQKRIHSRHSKLRRKLINALWSDGGETLAPRARRLAACCCVPSIRSGRGGALGVDLARCRDRLCPLCSSARGREVRGRVLAYTHSWTSCRFVTLTLALDGATLSERLTRLYECFRKLRSSPVWKSRIRGGVAVPEVTIGSQRQWHVHLHVLVTGDYIPQPQLKAAWLKVTGDSYIVDVRAVHDRGHAAKYIADYVAKPPDFITYTTAEIVEFAAALHGRRMLSTFGCAHASLKDDDTEDDVPGTTEHVCNLVALTRAMDTTNEPLRHACEILGRLGGLFPLLLDVDGAGDSMPEVDGRELVFATRVLEQVDRDFPAIPTAECLDRLRRESFSIPDPPPAPRYIQRLFSRQWVEEYR